MSNENVFKPYKQPYILVQSGVPVGIAPNGTVATNGQITLGTALPRVYSGGIWVYLPAGAVSGGVAGLYWCVMSSTTVGQVYTNFADTSQKFTPYIPTGTLVNAVGSNAAYTQTTGAAIVLVNATVAGNSLGLSGALNVVSETTNNNSAGTKVVEVRLGATVFGSSSVTTNTYLRALYRIINNGSYLSQFFSKFAYTYQSQTASNQAAIDTTVDNSLAFTANISAATDYSILESVTIEVLPS
jgi:hypothetical protein